jgi:hypothetical protein
MTTVPRGKIIGKRVRGEPTNEAEHSSGARHVGLDRLPRPRASVGA